MPQPIIELGGAPDAPIMHIAIANGFFAETYLPLLSHFFADYRVVCLPPRALWENAPEPPSVSAEGWRIMADDILAGLAAHQLEDVTLVGHSMGGTASMLAALKEPERFKQLVLLDPTILTQEQSRMLGEAQHAGIAEQFWMAQNALKRRNFFESKEAAYEHFAGKTLFERWPDQTLRLYVEHGLVPAPDGDGVVLRFTPGWEAYYFASGYAYGWEDLPKLNGLLPTLIIQAEGSDAFTDESYAAAQALVPSATFEQITGQPHLFPQTAPDETAQMIKSWLAKQS